ncbi:MAG: Phage head-tail joining protein [Firmicutes bacterium ADurb.Bin193]|nr:MAG: Phage head-tail joining protein [Firmicutes bacterium ADurb.Bin193]
MDFSKLRHRIIFLKPTDNVTNGMGETVPRYKPFKPYLPLPLQVQGEDVYLTHDSDGNAVLVYADGKPYAHKLALKEYSVAGFVSPMSGREYEESQKLRVETTYKISTRFFRNITPEMRILYDNKEFKIVSVLDLNEKHEELQIIAIHKDTHTAQDYSGDADE